MKLSCIAAPRRTLVLPALLPRLRCPGTRSWPPGGVKSFIVDGNFKVRCEISDKFRTGLDDGEEGRKEESEALEGLRREAEEVLGWDSICEQVSRFASTSGGRALCRSGVMRIGRDRSESQKLLEQTAAVISLLPRKLDFSGIEDVSQLVRLAASGEVLGARELCAVERTLRAARRLYEQLVEVSLEQGSRNRYLPLTELFTDCIFMTEWVQNIGNCIESNLFVILDRASSKLESIRSDRRKNMDNLEVSLKSISFRIFQGGGIDSPLVTKRRSRMCVGIRASHKSLLPNGIVLGVSSSGATYFMEPRDVMELNNMEVGLSNSEKEEELTILSKLTSELAFSQREVIHLMERIHELDIASARGAYAAWMNAAFPIFSELPEEIESSRREESLMVDIEGIHHPLFLETSFRNQSVSPLTRSDEGIQMDERVEPDENRELARIKTVPLDIKIKYGTKAVVISGPNTGGKTVSMKTLGLASLMSKAGLYLPARNKPRLPWFDQVLADIGDHQSLEHNLSTFSGHISRLCKILDAASRQSLVLLDEIGNGTDPSEGVVLSISILRHLVDRANLAVVTTHYTDLTLLKAQDSRFENAAMEFSIETLKPTYHILWGSTGNSNALSIAKAIGFDQKVLDHAQVWVEKLVPDKQKERQGFLYQSLLEERNKLETQARKAESILLEAKELFTEIHSEAEDLSRRFTTLKSMETQKVHGEVDAVKNQMDIVVKHFENQLKSATPNQFGALLRQAEASIASLVEAHCSNDDIPLEKNDGQTQCTLQIGDQVRVKALGGKLATVVGALGDDDYAMVQFGKIRLHVQRNDLNLIKRNINNALRSSLVKGQDQQQGFKSLTKDRNTDEDVPFGAAVQTSKNTVDLRGMRVEEASSYLDLAISGCKPRGVLFVIHGMGTGALKQRTLAILSKHPRVAKFEDESPMNYGCTIAYIK